ncbi:hypothetical protein EC957_000197 [Mortierella hygrophila]|uniref:DNA-directed DNA polymerase n=1 Tax=Mortierella hygrophila TaxID=979708 RepID=A0A9P6FG51_9FUNG|nr:hypothetical protein EC957_000197 [Mortierella hygrophila]
MPRNNNNSSNNRTDQHSSMSHSVTIPKKRPNIPPPPSIENSSSLLPTNREGLFARLDSAIESAAEEDAGRIPKDLLVGPNLKVESAGKKRRVVPAPIAASSSSHLTPTTTEIPGSTADTTPLPVLSSPSSSSLSVDSSNSSHILDKTPIKRSMRIISPTEGSHGSPEVVPSSVQSDLFSNLPPDQESSTYPRTRSKRHQAASSTLSPQAPLMELSAVSNNEILESTSAGSPSLSPPPESVGRIEQEADVALVLESTPEASVSQPLTSILDDAGSAGTTTAPTPSSASTAITIDDDEPPPQPVSRPEKHPTSLDELTGSHRPTKKRNDGSNKDLDRTLPISTRLEHHHESPPHNNGRSSSSPPPAPSSPTKTGGRTKKDKAVSGTIIEIGDDSDDDGSERPAIIVDPASTTHVGPSINKSPAAGLSTATSAELRSTPASGSASVTPPTSALPPEKDAGPLVRLYVIPTLMDKLVFSLSRDRVLDLKWEWLGPLEKILSTDPRGNQDAPALDQERTTHIVTALSDIEKVKKFLRVETIDYKRPMEPASYRIARSKTQQINSINVPVTNSPPLSKMSALPAEPNTEKQPRYAKFESVDGNENGEQLDFNDIVLGIKEGSLEGGEVSDDEHDQEEDKESEDDYNKAGVSDTKEKEAESSTRATKLPPELLEKLKKENKCFECQEQGHWANKCPKAANRGAKEDILLQIISSGKSEEPHTAGQKDEPKYNKDILEQLKVLMDYYETNKVKGSNEHFKVINYRKAITAIRALDYEIKSEEMALKIPRVGKKLAQKIGECISFGRIKKLDHLNWDQEKSKTETLFRSVYGVGSEMATAWYNDGLRTLDDLRALPNLTKNQISGLKFYEDLLVRIPRSEVEQIGKVVEAAAHKLHPEIESQVTGSYRRGKLDCGDIDIVVARPNIDNGDELFLIMDHILKDLINQGFLVDHLSLPTWEDSYATRPKHFKYMGICKLPGENQIHRHIDILVVPWMHLGAVLIYFTGNDICNRSMRLLASNRGMRLSDKGLFDNVVRGKNRKKVNEGRWVAGRTEREIFDYLKIKYLEPYEREC